ncbi:cation:proton antiporter [Streptomyces sp. NPDC006197]|uniref:cation:proton antiporter domain-containing protein n=1 Tax=Streptomyces sp. NPDC006197 TaxID=3156685 RepID=UPI0033B0A114
MTHALHVIAALTVVLLLARMGRTCARWLRQPEVVGEVTAGLLIGPAVLALADRELFDMLLPPSVLAVLKLVGQTGLVLYLVGLAHKLALGSEGPSKRTLSALVAGAFALPFVTGLILVGVIEVSGDSGARGEASFPAFLLMVAVAMSITAVPVLSRILGDRGMSDSLEGRFSLAAAVAMDGLGWIMLTLAIGLGAGNLSGLGRSGIALLVGGGCAYLLRMGLRTGPARRLCVRMPKTSATLLGAAALGTALLTEHLGMTAIVGAALVGLAITGDTMAVWAGPVASVSRAGRALTPVFFVVTGVTVLIGAFSAAPWLLIAAALVLGCVGKLAGGYLGARLGGMGRTAACRVGALMNTRGLTELIVLEAGHRAGILSAQLVLALIVMALATTAMTGPLLSLVDRAERRRGTAPAVPPASHAVPAESGSR